jgi:hypothetical protein
LITSILILDAPKPPPIVSIKVKILTLNTGQQR